MKNDYKGQILKPSKKKKSLLKFAQKSAKTRSYMLRSQIPT